MRWFRGVRVLQLLPGGGPPPSCYPGRRAPSASLVASLLSPVPPRVYTRLPATSFQLRFAPSSYALPLPAAMVGPHDSLPLLCPLHALPDQIGSYFALALPALLCSACNHVPLCLCVFAVGCFHVCFVCCRSSGFAVWSPRCSSLSGMLGYLALLWLACRSIL